MLLAATLGALAWANSPLAKSYGVLWDTRVSLGLGPVGVDATLRRWVNEGLIAIFFFVVTLEAKREFLQGHLAGLRRAVVPVVAAVGGMILPALIFLAFTAGTPFARGWAVPIVTDTAFALGVLALLGPRVVPEVRAFLLSLVVVDDVGAILVIGIVYAHGVSWPALGAAGLLLIGSLLLFRSGIYIVTLHAGVALLLWIAVFRSGLHATIAGVALAAVVPARPVFSMQYYAERATRLLDQFRAAYSRRDYDGASAALGQLEPLTIGTESPLDRMLRRFHPWASFVVLPVFALANAGVDLSASRLENVLSHPVSLGAALGLLLGKPLGIVVFTWLPTRIGLGRPPEGLAMRSVVGIGIVGGIGFSVSFLIAGIAYQDPILVDQAKLGVLLASVLAGTATYAYFRYG